MKPTRFDELYRQYAKDVYRFAYWLSGNHVDAEDITSEAFLRAWVSRSPIRMETVKAYLFTIARNLYLAKRKSDSLTDALPDDLASGKHSLEQTLSTSTELDRTLRFLATVAEPDRSAFLMRVGFAVPYREIARALSISESAAKVKVHRLRRKLNQLREADKL